MGEMGTKEIGGRFIMNRDRTSMKTASGGGRNLSHKRASQNSRIVTIIQEPHNPREIRRRQEDQYGYKRLYKKKNL